ncbi:methylamine utilization protein [Gammaproteobacteria bacterium]|nr:methylamine utilization protein [Gammaproteobacteria bacterium]
MPANKLLAVLLTTLAFSLGVQSVQAGNLEVVLEDQKGNPLKDAVIEIILPAIPVPADWDYEGLMDQKDKEFINNVVTIVAGSYVNFPNSDDIQHHVYSFSDNNTFELPLYSDTNADPVLFEKPGVTVVGCNIHDWMLGYIYVGESHLMALSDDLGIAVINDLPAGNYRFKLWHERARRQDQFSEHDVAVSDASVTRLELVLDLGRERRIRRAPTGVGDSYH